MGLKLAYTFRLSTSVNLELSAGVKNIFNSYQKDLDFGPLKDAGYVYGPRAAPHVLRRTQTDHVKR